MDFKFMFLGLLTILHLCLAFVFGLGVCIWGLAYFGTSKSDRTEKDRKEFISMLLGAIIFTGSFMLCIYEYNNTSWVVSEYPYSTERIVALNDSNNINGQFHLRSGYIEEDLYYQYIVKLRAGGFKANKVKASNATIYYTDDDNYRVEWYTKEKRLLHMFDYGKCVKIYIPEGSITSEYSIDLK